MRAVLDTNVTVSGLLWGGPPGRLLTLAAQRRVSLCTSQDLLNELRRVLDYAHLSRRLPKVQFTADSALQYFSRLCQVVQPVRLASVVTRDPSDDIVLACAEAARADMVVSGDDDLLALAVFRGIPILNAARALQVLEGAPPSGPSPGRATYTPQQGDSR